MNSRPGRETAPRVDLRRFWRATSGASLAEHLLFGIGMATAFSAIAVVVLGTVIIGEAFGASAEFGGVGKTTLALLVVIGGYYGAGLVAATAVWLLRPLRQSVLGWIVTGVAVATIAYGGIGLLGVLAYVYLDINMLKLESPEEAWSALPIVTLWSGLLAGVPGGLYFWWKRPWG